MFFSLLFFSINLFAGVKSLKEQAAQAYVASRPLKAIKRDLEKKKLNAELQEALVPAIINKYSKLCNWNGKLDKVLTIDPLDHAQRIPIAFSPDSTHVLIRFQSNIVHVWNVETKETIKILIGHTGLILSVAFSPDGHYALTGSVDQTARLWDLETGESIKILTGHTTIVTAVAFSQCGRYALTGSYDSRTRMWDIETGECIKVFEAHAGPVCKIRGNSNNTQIAVGYDQTEYKKSQACIWNAVTGQLIKRIPVNHHVGEVAFSPDNMQVLIGSLLDGKVFLWDPVTNRAITVFDHTKWYHYLVAQYAAAMAFNQDCTRVTIAYNFANGNVVYVVNLKTADIIHEVSSLSFLSSVAASSNGKYVLIGLINRDIYLWDLGYCTTMTLSEVLDIFIPLVNSQAESLRNVMYMQFLLC